LWRVRRGRDWASGAALIVASEEFEALRGFDESFFLLYEDRDLSFRYREAGHPMRTCRGIVVSHEIGTSSSAEGLDVRRRAWAVLSWIELRCAQAGAEAGAATARRVCGALRWEGLVGGILAASGLGRSRVVRKLREAGEVEMSVRAGGGVDGQGYYWRASRALSDGTRESDE
jgi:hypothetical protein